MPVSSEWYECRDQPYRYVPLQFLTRCEFNPCHHTTTPPLHHSTTHPLTTHPLTPLLLNSATTVSTIRLTSPRSLGLAAGHPPIGSFTKPCSASRHCKELARWPIST